MIEALEVLWLQSAAAQCLVQMNFVLASASAAVG